MENNEVNKFSGITPVALALLIGVDYYFRNTVPDAPSYSSLRGCVRDINYVDEYLKLKLGIPSTNIIKLTASSPNSNEDNMTNGATSGPLEAPEKWPTYENIIAAFNRVIEVAKAGDQVYIHYSGHGGRVPTLTPEQKGLDGLDETLVPTNIGNPGSRSGS
jgi:hypothetical protein